MIEHLFCLLGVFGNPAMPADTFGARFLVASMLWIMLIIIAVNRFSVVTEYRNYLVVGIIGMVFGLCREISMLVLEWGYLHGLYADRTMFITFSPIEHFFMMLSVMAICWYNLRRCEVIDWTSKVKHNSIWLILPVGMMIYSTIEWFKYVYLHFNNTLAIRFRDIPSDAVWHIIYTVILIYTLVLIYGNPKITYWLYAFFITWILDHGIRSVMFSTGIENDYIMTITYNLHLFGIAFYVLHITTWIIKRLTDEENRICPCLKYLEEWNK